LKAAGGNTLAGSIPVLSVEAIINKNKTFDEKFQTIKTGSNTGVLHSKRNFSGR